jgi:hypothetical protein
MSKALTDIVNFGIGAIQTIQEESVQVLENIKKRVEELEAAGASSQSENAKKLQHPKNLRLQQRPKSQLKPQRLLRKQLQLVSQKQPLLPRRHPRKNQQREPLERKLLSQLPKAFKKNKKRVVTHPFIC